MIAVPLFDGGVHDRATCESPATPVGADAVSAVVLGTTDADAVEADAVPAALIAAIVK